MNKKNTKHILNKRIFLAELSLAAFFIILLCLLLSSCAASIPVGKDAKYGYVDFSVSYKPNFHKLVSGGK